MAEKLDNFDMRMSDLTHDVISSFGKGIRRWGGNPSLILDSIRRHPENFKAIWKALTDDVASPIFEQPIRIEFEEERLIEDGVTTLQNFAGERIAIEFPNRGERREWIHCDPPGFGFYQVYQANSPMTAYEVYCFMTSRDLSPIISVVEAVRTCMEIPMTMRTGIRHAYTVFSRRLETLGLHIRLLSHSHFQPRRTFNEWQLEKGDVFMVRIRDKSGDSEGSVSE